MQNNFYTYIHRKPNGCIFYVGKGKNQRAYSIHGRNPHWRRVYEKYGSFDVEIIEDNLLESQSFELEEFIISMIGIKSQGGTLVNMTTGGEGVSGYTPTPEVCKKISEKAKGIQNGRSDKATYTFVNFYTQEEIVATRQGFTEITKIKVQDLFKGNVLTVFSWCLKDNLHLVKLPKNDCRVYTFMHTDGAIIVTTRREFKIKTGTDVRNLFKSEKWRYKSVAGWSLQSN